MEGVVFTSKPGMQLFSGEEDQEPSKILLRQRCIREGQVVAVTLRRRGKGCKIKRILLNLGELFWAKGSDLIAGPAYDPFKEARPDLSLPKKESWSRLTRS